MYQLQEAYWHRLSLKARLKLLGSGKLLSHPSQKQTATTRQLRLPVPSCPSKMNTHPWTLRKAWLTVSPLQGGGEACREGNQQALGTDRKLVQGYCGSADSLPAGSRCSRPGREHKLAADPFAEGPVGTAGAHPSSPPFSL